MKLLYNLAAWRAPLTLVGTAFGMLLLITMSLSGCGGGGGGGGNNNPGGCIGKITPPGNPALATISGFVYDNVHHNPVNNANVTAVVPGGVNQAATTDCNGKFVITNVPLTTTTFTVASPDPVAYYNYANYNGKLYDLVLCKLPLPVLSAGANAPFTEVDMYLGGPSNFPPSPPGGCPM